MPERSEGRFDTARRYLRYVSVALIGLGGIFASGALVAAGAFDIATDVTIGEEISKGIKKLKGKQ